MTTRRIVVLFNPGARGDHAADPRVALGLDDDVDTDGASAVEFHEISSLDDARDTAAKVAREGADTAVAAGGDGTVNAVASGLLGSDTALGVLPLGTMNVFAREMGIPPRSRDAWATIRAGDTRRIDVGEYRSADGVRGIFVQLAGIGLDARILKDTSFESKRWLGPVSYMVTGVRLLTETPPKVRVRSDHGDECEGMGVLFGNGGHYAGPFRLFTDALNDDGWLDACVFTGHNPLALFRYVQGVLLGIHREFSDVVYLRGRRFEVETPDILIEADGDVAGATPAVVELHPSSLEVVAPPR